MQSTRLLPLGEMEAREPSAEDCAAWDQHVAEAKKLGIADTIVPLHKGFAGEQVELLEWISPAKWQGLQPPRREWLVQNCFAAGNVGLISGDGGIGKTILLLQLMAAAAMGRPWLDLEVRRGRSLFLACEDDADELWRRLYDISRAMDVELADLGENMLLRPRVGQQNALIEFERYTGKAEATNLYTRLLTRARAFGATYVVIDTATQTFAGNQNNETQVSAYINQLRRLAISIQGVVILTKHPSVSGLQSGSGLSGNVAWNNSVRSRLYFRKTKAGREIAGVKNNYGQLIDPIPLKWERGLFVIDRPVAPTWQTE
jgi:RecA-family ATPase